MDQQAPIIPLKNPHKTRFWKTLRFRIALMTSGLMLLVMAGFGAFVYFSMDRNLSASVDVTLELNAAQALTAIEFEDGEWEMPDSFVEGSATARLRAQGFIMRILSPEGQVLRGFGAYQTLPVSEESLRAAQAQESDLSTLNDPETGDTVRLLTVPILNNNRTMGVYQVGQSLNAVQNTLHALLRALLIGIPMLVLVSGFSGYLLASRALAPIDKITRTARHISADDLTTRLKLPPTNDEVGRLAATFDEMLDRIAEAFRRERQFTADASHELRTPLAAMQAILEVTRERRRRPEEYEQALDDLSEETDRLRALSENLLHLARGDSQRQNAYETIALGTLLGDVVDSLSPLAEAKELSLSCEIGSELTVRGDTDELISLFANILDNAIKYTDSGSIRVEAKQGPDGMAEIHFTDTGIGITPEHLDHIYERFYRVEASRTSEGMGLGLAIALQIVLAHDGAIDVKSRVGQGTAFRVQLPLAR